MFENAAFNKRRKKINCLLCLPGLSKYLIKQGCFIGELIILSSPVSVGFFLIGLARRFITLGCEMSALCSSRSLGGRLTARVVTSSCFV